MLRVGAERDELRVVADQRGCPTPAWLIADTTAEILSQGIKEPGIRHLVASGETTWHGFAEAIFDEAVRAWADRPAAARDTDHDGRLSDARATTGLFGARYQAHPGRIRNFPAGWRQALAMTFDSSASHQLA